MRSLDLDVDAPEKVPRVLRAASEAFQASAAELESAWQDREAGLPGRPAPERLRARRSKSKPNSNNGEN